MGDGPRPTPLTPCARFDAAAPHLNFTRAAIRLCVSQGAVSHQVAQLERRLGTGCSTACRAALRSPTKDRRWCPVVADAFDRVAATLDQYADGRFRETLKVGVVGTFATGWLLPRLDTFARAHPPLTSASQPITIASTWLARHSILPSASATAPGMVPTPNRCSPRRWRRSVPP